MLNHTSPTKDYFLTTLAKILLLKDHGGILSQTFMDLEVARLKQQSILEYNYPNITRKDLQELLQELQSEQELR